MASGEQGPPSDLRFAASELLGAAQRFRVMAAMKRRRGSAVVADELIHDAERLERVAHRMNEEADRAT